MTSPFIDFLIGEQEIERQTLEQYKIEFDICIKLWEFLINDLIKSVDGNCILFMYFKHQVDMSLRNSITSLMRLQSAQCKQNLRFALENIALCMYYLNEFEEFNEIFVGTEDRKMHKITDKLKEKSYKMIETKYPEINEIIKRYKKIMNDYGAHANLGLAALNTKLVGKEKMRVSFFDTLSTYHARNQILLVSDIIIGFIEAVANQRKDPKMLPLKEDWKSKYLVLRKKYTDHKNKLFSDIKVAQGKTERNEKCWCGSDLKFKKCHGR